MDQLYEHFMDHFEIYSHTVGFPELALPSTIMVVYFIAIVINIKLYCLSCDNNVNIFS